MVLTILLGPIGSNISGTVLALRRVSLVRPKRHRKAKIGRNFCSREGLLWMRKGPRLAATGFAQKQAAILNQGTSDASNRNRFAFSGVVLDCIFGCSTWTICRPGLGLVEEQQSIAAWPWRHFWQRGTWVEAADRALRLGKNPAQKVGADRNADLFFHSVVLPSRTRVPFTGKPIPQLGRQPEKIF